MKRNGNGDRIHKLATGLLLAAVLLVVVVALVQRAGRKSQFVSENPAGTSAPGTPSSRVRGSSLSHVKEGAAREGKRGAGGMESAATQSGSQMGAPGETEPDRRTQLGSNPTSGSSSALALSGTITGPGGETNASLPSPLNLNKSELSRPDTPSQKTEDESGQAVKATRTPVPGGSIAGRVTDPQGNPMAGVGINVVALDLGTARTVLGSATTGRDGTYLTPRILEGHVAIQLHTLPDSDLFPPEPRVVVISAGQDLKNENFVLNEGDVVEGRVENASSGDPLMGATVEATLQSRTVHLTSDADGKFRVTGIPPGQAVKTLVVSYPEYEAQTRTGLTMLEGSQLFRLKASSDLTLSVTWAMDGTPVTSYVYRLLRKGMVGVYVDIGRPETTVQTDDGSATLQGVGEGDWRVEVTVLTPEGKPSDIRGSARFTLDSSQEGMDIPITIDAGRTLSGTVVLNQSGGDPVQGAEIQFIPPTSGFGRFPDPRSQFRIAAQTSGAAGHFHFEGLAPGHYELTATKDTFLPPQAVKIDVPYDTDPTPVEVVIISGGVLYGQVFGTDDKPLTGATMDLREQRINADGWEDRLAKTDSEGRYRFEGVRSGSHYLRLSGSGLEQKGKAVDLAPGEEKEVNFDLSGAIEVTGVVTVNSAVPLGKISFIGFISDGDVRSPWFALAPDGGYQARLKPGEYVLQPAGSLGTQGTTQPFTIPESVDSFRKDFDLDIVTADVILVFPSEEQFSTGQTTIRTRNQDSRYSFIRVDMHQEARQVVSLVGGQYMATFSSRNGVWRGESPWITVGRGLDNQFVLEMKKSIRGARVGGWTPGQLSNNTPTTLTFDVTPEIQSTGILEVLILYESGAHAVESYSATLRVNGQIADHDEHFGWSGTDKFANSYHLALDKLTPGAQYTIEVSLRCDGGQDSTGSIYFNLN